MRAATRIEERNIMREAITQLLSVKLSRIKP